MELQADFLSLGRGSVTVACNTFMSYFIFSVSHFYIIVSHLLVIVLVYFACFKTKISTSNFTIFEYPRVNTLTFLRQIFN